MSSEVEFEPRVGGQIHVKGLHPGTVVEFEPPRRMVWSWDPDNGQDPNSEAMTLYPECGGTRLRLVVEARGKWATDLMYFGGIKAGWRQWLEAMQDWIEAGRAAPGTGP